MPSSLWVGVSTLWVSTFLYGIYLVLFCRCMYIFYRGGNKQVALFTSAIIMFILSTTTVILSLLQGAIAYGNAGASLGLEVERLQDAGALVYVTNNLLADALLIYRCYVIWDTIWITVVPLILLITTMILGYMIQLPLFFILSLTINLFVPTLVAGRLWWVIRRLRGPSGAVTRRKGRNAMIIILESGLIYSLFVSIHMGFFHFQNPNDEIIYAALGQVVGIVPTLIIVRVGLGVSENGFRGGETMVGSCPPGLQSSASLRRHSQSTIVNVTSTEKSGWDAETIV
ncbi:hypothetical protein B0H11DRAFT_1989235 [Mycena galericulata]|nr:hypothetical protein B0H11DRAFT_1989235 [Mycena galericulata]